MPLSKVPWQEEQVCPFDFLAWALIPQIYLGYICMLVKLEVAL
jgi:hypothetical protein